MLWTSILIIFFGSGFISLRTALAQTWNNSTFKKLSNEHITSSQWSHVGNLTASMIRCGFSCLENSKCYAFNHEEGTNQCLLLPVFSLLSDQTTRTKSETWKYYQKLELPKAFLSQDESSLCMKYVKPRDDLSDEDPYLCFVEPASIANFRAGKTDCLFTPEYGVDCPGHDIIWIDTTTPANYTEMFSRCARLGCHSSEEAYIEGRRFYFKSLSIAGGGTTTYLESATYWSPQCK